jgi:hypothetical protein
MAWIEQSNWRRADPVSRAYLLEACEFDKERLTSPRHLVT